MLHRHVPVHLFVGCILPFLGWEDKLVMRTVSRSFAAVIPHLPLANTRPWYHNHREWPVDNEELLAHIMKDLNAYICWPEFYSNVMERAFKCGQLEEVRIMYRAYCRERDKDDDEDMDPRMYRYLASTEDAAPTGQVPGSVDLLLACECDSLLALVDSDIDTWTVAHFIVLYGTADLWNRFFACIEDSKPLSGRDLEQLLDIAIQNDSIAMAKVIGQHDVYLDITSIASLAIQGSVGMIEAVAHLPWRDWPIFDAVFAARLLQRYSDPIPMIDRLYQLLVVHAKAPRLASFTAIVLRYVQMVSNINGRSFVIMDLIRWVDKNPFPEHLRWHFAREASSDKICEKQMWLWPRDYDSAIFVKHIAKIARYGFFTSSPEKLPTAFYNFELFCAERLDIPPIRKGASAGRLYIESMKLELSNGLLQ